MQPTDKDPWEDQEDLIPPVLASGDDPEPPDDEAWDGTPAVEDNSIVISEEDGDALWDVKYAEGARPPTARQLEARIKRNQFLEVLMNTGNPVRAAASVGRSWREMYAARQRHPKFDENWIMAKKIYHEFVANEKLRKRAIDGVREPQWYQGEIVGYTVKFDSGLTQFYMKGAMPEVYGDKRELKIDGGLTFGIAWVPGTVLDAEAWQQQAQIQQKGIKMIDVTPQQMAQKLPPVKKPEVERG